MVELTAGICTARTCAALGRIYLPCEKKEFIKVGVRGKRRKKRETEGTFRGDGRLYSGATVMAHQFRNLRSGK